MSSMRPRSPCADADMVTTEAADTSTGSSSDTSDSTESVGCHDSGEAFARPHTRKLAVRFSDAPDVVGFTHHDSDYARSDIWPKRGDRARNGKYIFKIFKIGEPETTYIPSPRWMSSEELVAWSDERLAEDQFSASGHIDELHVSEASRAAGAIVKSLKLPRGTYAAPESLNARSESSNKIVYE